MENNIIKNKDKNSNEQSKEIKYKAKFNSNLCYVRPYQNICDMENPERADINNPKGISKLFYNGQVHDLTEQEYNELKDRTVTRFNERKGFLKQKYEELLNSSPLADRQYFQNKKDEFLTARWTVPLFELVE